MTLLFEKNARPPRTGGGLVPFWKVVLSRDDQHPVEQNTAAERHSDRPDNERNGGLDSPRVVVPGDQTLRS